MVPRQSRGELDVKFNFTRFQKTIRLNPSYGAKVMADLRRGVPRGGTKFAIVTRDDGSNRGHQIEARVG